MELGIYSFAEIEDQTPGERLRDLLEEIELADQLGLDVFGVGEHHRPDFSVSAPVVVLAAAAERTKRIRLTSAVTVLSSDDPIRVHQQFATLDQLSGGRAEIMAGRGSFIESFPLFGYDLNDYDMLFEQKLEALLDIRSRPAELGVYPVPAQPLLPVWVAVGGSPESAARAGRLGLPMALAIIGGMPERFAPFAEIHRQAAIEAGHDPVPALSINSHGFVAETSQQAADEAFPAFKRTMDRIGRERGWAAARAADVRGVADEARRELRRQPAGGGREDPLPARDLPAPPLPRAVQRRHAAAREHHALDRAVRDGGRARGAQGALLWNSRRRCGVVHLVEGRPFEELVRPHQEIAFRVAYLITRNAADAEDAVQDGLVKAWRAFGRFRRDAPMRPWLLRIVANEARNRRRSTRRREALRAACFPGRGGPLARGSRSRRGRAGAAPRRARHAAGRDAARARVPPPALALGGGDGGSARRPRRHGQVALRAGAREAAGGLWISSVS